ncbi:MAG: hypothetical protein HYR60_14925 [Acidobacteria bacterium]|nr:hypothetical protein [Acidobacteriota bacterium]
MGVVYKARDTRLQRWAALKILPPDMVADPERRRRFVQEARAASALNHPNIVTIYDIDTAEATGGLVHFIAMEYVEGQTLRQVIRPGGLPLDECPPPIPTRRSSTPLRRSRGRSQAPFLTCRRSNWAASPPTRAATSSRSASCCSRCWRASGPLPARPTRICCTPSCGSRRGRSPNYAPASRWNSR